MKNVDYLGRPSGASPNFLRIQMERLLHDKQATSDGIVKDMADRHERIQNSPKPKESKHKKGILPYFWW